MVKTKRSKALGLIGSLALLLITYQNCSTDVAFTGNEVLQSLNAVNDEPQYAEVTIGNSANFPPLKLFFVVDNSGTMQANQINLSSAFSRMFADSNADNLTPFDTTAYIFNTAQVSLPRSDANFAKLPKNDLNHFEQMTETQLKNGPRAYTLDGQIPGDLVGYRIVDTTNSNLKSLEYLPAPVAGFKAGFSGRSTASLGIHRTKNSSVTNFADEFSNRLNILDPARSAMDPVKKTGILDPVIDKESGLCTLARIMRNKDAYLQAGDIAAYVIVSDENDADEKGTSCLQSVKDYQPDEVFFDGYCTSPKTKLTYREINPNPSSANCKVNYSTGFKYVYTYNLPKTDVEYYIQRRTYTIRQTIINYKTATHTFTQPRVVLSYHTKNPTYQVPQTKISYYKKVESCDIRDGVKFNCTYTYPQFTTGAIEQAFSDCLAFANGKIPSDALLNDSQHPVTCQALPLVTKSGTCTEGESNKLNCKQNYSANRTTSAPINGSVATTCAAFASGKLPSNAVVSDAGYEVQCQDSPIAASASGLCTTGKANCSNNIGSKTSASIDGITTDSSATACMAYAVSKKSNFESNAILNISSYPVTCSEGSGRVVTNEGVCSSLGHDTKNCSESPTSTKSTGTYNGTLAAGQQCKDFIQAAVGSGRIIASSPAPKCTLSSSVQTITSAQKTMSYSNAVVASYTPTVNASCLTVLKDHIKSTDAVPEPISCTVKSIITGSSSHNSGQLCAEITHPLSFCSTSAKRGCVATDVPAGSPYMANLTNSTFDGQFTCNTPCSETGFCKTKPDTVGDNYKDCATADATTNRNFKGELHSEKASVCKAGEDTLPTVTKGPYKDTTTKTDYVAGSNSENGIPNALANYIRDENKKLFGENTPAVSVFVRQPGDSLGTNGSYGTAYNTFASLMDGQKKSVLSDASGYAQSLQSLSEVIREKLSRSFNVPVRPGDQVHRVWHRKAGQVGWGEPVDSSDWSSSGGTVTLNPNYQIQYGDQFRIEYY